MLLLLAHLIGLVLGVGSATVKLSLLLKCTADHAFVPIYLRVARPITRLLIAGLILMTLSGIGWLLTGYELTPLLVVKLILVGTIWILGPVIDNAIEPRFQRLAATGGEPVTDAFTRIQRLYLGFEVFATGLFYFIIVIFK